MAPKKRELTADGKPAPASTPKKQLQLAVYMKTEPKTEPNAKTQSSRPLDGEPAAKKAKTAGDSIPLQSSTSVGDAAPSSAAKTALVPAAAGAASTTAAAGLGTPPGVHRIPDTPPPGAATIPSTPVVIPGTPAIASHMEGPARLENSDVAAVDAIVAGQKISLPPMTNQERNRSKKQFDRTLAPTAERHGRTTKCPEDIAMKIKNSPHMDGQHYFALWFKCNQDWGRVTIIETLVKSKSKTTSKEDGWRMRHELERERPIDIVNGIIEEKLQNPKMWRPNPDCPTIKAAIQYWVALKEGQVVEEKATEESKTKLEADLGQEEAKLMIRARHTPISDAVATPSVVNVATAGPSQIGGGEPIAKTQKQLDRELKEQQQAADKARRAAERDAAKQDARELKERMKDAPETKAKKKVTALSNQAQDANDRIVQCRTNMDVPSEKRTLHQKLLQNEAKTMRQVRTDLESALEKKADLSTLLLKAEDAPRSYGQTCRAWKQTVLFHKPEPPA